MLWEAAERDTIVLACLESILGIVPQSIDHVWMVESCDRLEKSGRKVAHA